VDIPGTPNIARVYDYLLGGKDNYEADRVQAALLCADYEGLPRLVRTNRDFVTEATRWAAQQGISQFIDLGCGLPTRPGVHETARGERPGARVAYVDNDPVVLSHVQALEARGEGLAAVLHFVPSPDARRITAGYRDALAPGSVIVISAVRWADPELAARMVELYSAGHLQSHDEADVAGWLEGLDLVPPGIVAAAGWRGQWGDCLTAQDPRAHMMAAVGRKA
jgi:hypothetical protein